jgi:hypothetical protein
MSFLDENCLVFDNEDENKLEYTQIHNVSRAFLKSYQILGLQKDG